MTKEEIVKALAHTKPLSFMAVSKGGQSELTINGWSMEGDPEDIDAAADFLTEVLFLVAMARKSLTTEET